MRVRERREKNHFCLHAPRVAILIAVVALRTLLTAIPCVAVIQVAARKSGVRGACLWIESCRLHRGCHFLSCGPAELIPIIDTSRCVYSGLAAAAGAKRGF